MVFGGLGVARGKVLDVPTAAARIDMILSTSHVDGGRRSGRWDTYNERECKNSVTYIERSIRSTEFHSYHFRIDM